MVHALFLRLFQGACRFLQGVTFTAGCKREMLDMNEFYSTVDTLVGKLRLEGHAAWAERLDHAVIAGSTGTEIFVELGGTLRDMKKSRTLFSPETQELISALWCEIDSALQRAGGFVWR